MLVGDFNAEETEPCLNSFLSEFNITNLVKKNNRCFSSKENRSFIDLTNSSNSFQHTQTISSGLSENHKMVVTVLKNTFSKIKAKGIIYRSYTNFDKE